MYTGLRRTAGLVALVLGVAGCGGSGGTEPVPTNQSGSVTGRVSVGSVGHAGVEIALAGGGTQTTNGAGQYTFPNLAPATYSLTLTTPEGFDLAAGHTAAKSATVRAGQATTLDWGLQPRATNGPVQEIRMSGIQFSPSSVTIAPGTTVRWINDGGAHTVTPDDTGQPGVWTGSGLLNQGQVFEHTFNVSGQTYNYHCQPHRSAGMTGTITVQ